jgi:hypothetical protein
LRGCESDVRRYVVGNLGPQLDDLTADDLHAVVDGFVGSGRSGSKVCNVLVPLQVPCRKHRP